MWKCTCYRANVVQTMNDNSFKIEKNKIIVILIIIIDVRLSIVWNAAIQNVERISYYYHWSRTKQINDVVCWRWRSLWISISWEWSCDFNDLLRWIVRIILNVFLSLITHSLTQLQSISKIEEILQLKWRATMLRRATMPKMRKSNLWNLRCF